MPIPVTCQCGQSFAAGDHLAGRTVQCPKCKSPLAIPNPQAAAAPAPAAPQAAPSAPSIFEDAGMRTFRHEMPHCPSCNAELQPGAILCVKCGFHMKLGRRIGQEGSAVVTDGHGATAQLALARAAKVIDEEREEAKKAYKEGMPWWAVLGIFLFFMTFLIGMLMLPGHVAFVAGGGTILVACTLASIYYWVRILIIAFTDNVVHGLCCLFVPCYILIYSVMHWDECGGFFLRYFFFALIGNVVGGGMGAVAPYMVPKEGQMYLPDRVPAVVLVMGADEYRLPRAMG